MENTARNGDLQGDELHKQLSIVVNIDAFAAPPVTLTSRRSNRASRADAYHAQMERLNASLSLRRSAMAWNCREVRNGPRMAIELRAPSKLALSRSRRVHTN